MAKRLEFSERTKREAYALRGGLCPGLIEIKSICGNSLRDGVEYDHIKRNEVEPDNSLENCRPLCPSCHRLKSKLDAASAKKGRLIRRETKKSQRPKAKFGDQASFPCNRNGQFKKKCNGDVVNRETGEVVGRK